jgi:hypothetical protein
MQTTELVWHILVVLLVALIVFAIMTTANIITCPKSRALVSIGIGLVFGMSIGIHKSLQRRDEDELENLAKVMKPNIRQRRIQQREAEDDEGEGYREAEDDEEEDEEQADDDDEQADDEEEEEHGSDKLREDEEEEETRKDAEEDANDILNTSKNVYAGYSRISAASRRRAQRNMKDAGKYLEGEDPQVGRPGWIKESELKHWEKLLTYDGLRKIQDSILYAKESYKDHEFNEAGEGMDQRYVDPTLLTYSPEFAAYGGQDYIIDPRLLSVNAPITF